MDTKRMQLRFTLIFLANMLSLAGLIKALGHGTPTQIAAAAGGFLIFMCIFILFIYRRREIYALRRK